MIPSIGNSGAITNTLESSFNDVNLFNENESVVDIERNKRGLITSSRNYTGASTSLRNNTGEFTFSNYNTDELIPLKGKSDSITDILDSCFNNDNFIYESKFVIDNERDNIGALTLSRTNTGTTIYLINNPDALFSSVNSFGATTDTLESSFNDDHSLTKVLSLLLII